MSVYTEKQFKGIISGAQESTLRGILSVDQHTRSGYALSWGIEPGTYTAIVWDTFVRQGFAAVTEGPCPT